MSKVSDKVGGFKYLKTVAWSNELYVIIQDYKDGTLDPLDGDETENLAKIIKLKLDLMEGNITEEEYFEAEI